MSDQVVFTKEEVEKIKEFVNSFRGRVGLHIDHIDDKNAKYIEEILDSPRPRPKVSLHMLEACSIQDYEGIDHWKPRARTQADLFGFDVED